MPEIAIGRKEILKFFHVDMWRTIQDWKAKDEGFRKILHRHPISKKPFIIQSEALQWMVAWEKINKKKCK